MFNVFFFYNMGLKNKKKIWNSGKNFNIIEKYMYMKKTKIIKKTMTLKY